MKNAWASGLAIALAATSAGCIKESIYTTKRMTVPVMIGPIKTLQASAPVDFGKLNSEVKTEVENYFYVASHREGNYNVTTTAWKRQGSNKFDRAIGEALLTCPNCGVKTNRVRVGSYHMYLLFSTMEKNWAGLEGTLHGW